MVNSARICAILPALALLVLSLRAVACSGTQGPQSTTNSSTLQILSQLSEKLFTKFNSYLVMPNGAKARGYDSWGYMDSYSHDLYGKSDYSWIIPLIIVVGFGTLLIPLMGTLMTTMITQGTINLTAGRRKRSSEASFVNSSANWSNVIQTVEDALAKFGKHLKQWKSK